MKICTARAVHGLQREDAIVIGLVAGNRHLEHVVAVPAPVAGGFPERFVEHLRSVDLLIGAGQPPAHIGNQRLEHAPALAVPEDDARPFLLEMEQVHLAAEAAVVALLGFRQDGKIAVEILLALPSGAVDAGQHRVVAVAAPIGAGHLHQLEGRADLPRRGHMRATAEVEPVALVVDLQVLAFGDRIDQLDLVALALVGKDLARLVARPDFAGERLVALNDLLHPLLDLRQIVGREGLVLGKIVIEAVLDHRPDGDLRAGPELLHGLGHHMGGVVADQFERAGVLAGDDLDPAGLDRFGEIAQRAIERDGDGLLGERLGNGFRHIATGRAGGIIANRAIGKRQRNSGHRKPPIQSRQRMRVVWENRDGPACARAGIRGKRGNGKGEARSLLPFNADRHRVIKVTL